MSYVEQLREELVAAAARERARTWPRLPLRPRRPLALAAGLALAAILAIAVAIAARDDRDVRPVKPPAPEGRPLFDGTLVPKERYRTRNLVPALSFVVADDNWMATETESQDVLALSRVTRGGPSRVGPWSTLVFLQIDEVYDPRVRDLEDARTLAPADLVENWFSAHPDIRPSRGGSVTVAGVPGMSLDAEVRFTRPAHEDPACRERFRRPCTFLTPTLSLFDGMHLRIMQLRSDPELLTIVTVAMSKRRLDALNRAAAPVLDSLSIDIP